MEDTTLIFSSKTEKMILNLLFDLAQIFSKLKESFLYKGNSYYHFFYRLHFCYKSKISIGGVKFLDIYIEEDSKYKNERLVVVLSLSDKYLTSVAGKNNNFDKFIWLYKFPVYTSYENFGLRNDFDNLIPEIELVPTEILFIDEFTKLAEIIHTKVVLDDSVS